ncbi:hypothetical protein DICVIV_01042 [Dictyocaulus viviparus]|uniref:Uncharacterized protein n=1 Tax=Dictyocaulus viviparus TaxID=29172 RepID=A0A0D8Y7Z0_DICVI|nr:hypothetical protein DICVIV_01042 [Dictyocaulus viviparus]
MFNEYCRLLAAALAVGRKYEMTDEEAIELLNQIKAENSSKKPLPLEPMMHVVHESKEDVSSSEDEWEELELADTNDYNLKNVQVTLNKVVEKDWWALYLRQEVNKVVRNNWENSHKMPADYQDLVGKQMTTECASRIAKWYNSTFKASGDSIKYEPNLCRYESTERYSEMIAQERFENDADRAAVG